MKKCLKETRGYNKAAMKKLLRNTGRLSFKCLLEKPVLARKIFDQSRTLSIKAPFTRERFHVEPYQNRTDRPRVYTGTDGTVPYKTASGTRTGPSRK